MATVQIRVRRPLVQPFVQTPEGQPIQCSNAKNEKFFYEHPDKLYQYWYQRAPRDGSARGELRLQITEAEMKRFASARTFASKLVNEEMVKIHRKEAGWWLVTGAQLPEWDAKTNTFHDPLSRWVLELNKFFLPTDKNLPVVVERPARKERLAVSADGKITLKRPSADEAQLHKLLTKFSHR